MMSEENMEMGIPYDFTTPWHGGGMGGFQKLLTSPIYYDPEQAELLLPGYENTNNNNSNDSDNNNNYGKFNAMNYAQVQGGAEQESCVTAVGFQSRSNSEAAEDLGVSDTATQEEQQENPMMNAQNMALAITEKGEGDGGKRRKRKRVKAVKNSEEVESQRMTHIEVERNRRKQMNEHLGVLRSLIPDSYVQRGDQASIIGGAIDLVKELEQVLQSLQLQKIKKDSKERRTSNIPQNCLITPPKPCSARSSNSNSKYVLDTCIKELREAESTIIADIEVTLIETHASIKILSRKRPGQLVNVITALESLHMTTLHLNITTIDQTVMFSFNIKVEDECKLTSANEIATALHQILRVVHSNDRNHALN